MPTVCFLYDLIGGMTIFSFFLNRSREVEALGTTALASHFRIVNIRDKNTSPLGHWDRTPEQPFSSRCGKFNPNLFTLRTRNFI